MYDSSRASNQLKALYSFVDSVLKLVINIPTK